MESREKVANIAFYRFIDVEDPLQLQISMNEACEKLNLKGTILIAPEGLNGMVAGKLSSVEKFVAFLKSFSTLKEMLIKWSYSKEVPFKRLLIKVKKEILTDRSSGEKFRGYGAPHLKPKELHKFLKAGEDIVLIDIRNEFEMKYGSFKGALNPKTRSFSQFSEFVKKLNIPKTKKIVTYCTGGIRCEKGSANLMAAGFKNVFQLEGGILEYLRQTSGEYFEGSCFVFDDRVALDHDLKPIPREYEKL